jgi:hypothetical protein
LFHKQVLRNDFECSSFKEVHGITRHNTEKRKLSVNALLFNVNLEDGKIRGKDEKHTYFKIIPHKE